MVAADNSATIIQRWDFSKECMNPKTGVQLIEPQVFGLTGEHLQESAVVCTHHKNEASEILAVMKC